MSDRIGANHRILSVIAPHSKSGKTLFVTHLLQNISGLGCLKISPAHGHHHDFDNVRVSGGNDFYFEDPGKLGRPGKDTAIYLDTGARQVERLRHRGDGLAPGLEAAFDRFQADIPVVVESSSAVQFLTPLAVVLVVRPPIREMKPATERILPDVTDLLINTSQHYDDTKLETKHLHEQLGLCRPKHTWVCNLAGEELPVELLKRIRLLLVG